MKCISISHKNSTTKQREIFAFNDEEIRDFYDIVKSKACEGQRGKRAYGRDIS